MVNKFKEGLKPDVRMEMIKMTMLMPENTLQALTLENWIELAIRTDDMLFSSLL
jgi:hypothetical protein